GSSGVVSDAVVGTDLVDSTADVGGADVGGAEVTGGTAEVGTADVGGADVGGGVVGGTVPGQVCVRLKKPSANPFVLNVDTLPAMVEVPVSSAQPTGVRNVIFGVPLSEPIMPSAGYDLNASAVPSLFVSQPIS